MISKITIKNYKSLKNNTIDLSNLNILAGLNGMGKSSFIQSLLLLRQSHQQQTLWTQGLSLNGELVNVGTSKDAFCESGDDSEKISFAIQEKEENYIWNFKYEIEERNAEVIKPIGKKPKKLIIQQSSLFNKDFYYLNAERISPRPYFISSHFEVSQNQNIGIHGEFAANFLEQCGVNKINNDLKHSKSKGDSLLENVEQWMSEISPGTKIASTSSSDMGITKLGYSFVYANKRTESFRPTNVGFGITYALPIIITLLWAKPGSLIILENPESHIHPMGQEKLADLIYKVSENDVQIIIETHSDHIIDRLRKHGLQNLKTSNKKSKVKTLFFSRNYKDHITSIDIVELDVEENLLDLNNFYSELKSHYKKIDSVIRKNKKPLIITEGKTDWKHLKNALYTFKKKNLYEDLNLEFLEFEEEIDMGEAELRSICRQFCKTHQPRKIICVFDRDLPTKIMNEIENNSKPKNWGNNVYSFAIPKPRHRKKYDDNSICIELYYTEKDLKTKDRNGKRLLFDNEIKRNVSQYVSEKKDTEIFYYLTTPKIECEFSKKPYDKDVNEIIDEETKLKVGLSKGMFAKNIYEKIDKFIDFDVSAFKEIFSIIEKIIN